MSEYTNFEVGQKFPLPIATQADGAMFQVDANGAMFILQLSRTDVIAREAFRTGEMEFAFYEQDGLLFLLYQIDGIFKEGWGDAPLSLHNLKAELLPTEKSLQDRTMHLYLVDTTLQILLALFTQFFAKTFQHALLDTGDDGFQTLTVEFVQCLLVEITLQHRLGKQPHGFNYMHHIQIHGNPFTHLKEHKKKAHGICAS